MLLENILINFSFFSIKSTRTPFSLNSKSLFEIFRFQHAPAGFSGPYGNKNRMVVTLTIHAVNFMFF